MEQEKLGSLLKDAIRIARAAGDDILEVCLDEVERKEDGSPLTRADMASHHRITGELARLSPSIPIVSEEGNVEEIRAAEPDVFWLVDPLDGTKEFIKGNGEYTVNIALIECGRPVLGVIHAPEQGWVCYASEGRGCSWQEEDGEPEEISAHRPENALLTAAVSRSHPSEETEVFLEEEGVEETLPRGSSLKFCAVARGEADVYPRPNPTCLWDTAAGTIIAREAGCRVTNLTGSDLRHDLASGIKHHGFIVAGPRMQ